MPRCGVVNLLSGLPDVHLLCDTHPMSTPSANRYKHHRFPGEIISHGVWLYFRFCLSYRDVEELLFARGIIVTYEAIRQWYRKFGQSYANQLRRRRPQPGDKRATGDHHGQTQKLWRGQAGDAAQCRTSAAQVFEQRAETSTSRHASGSSADSTPGRTSRTSRPQPKGYDRRQSCPFSSLDHMNRQ